MNNRGDKHPAFNMGTLYSCLLALLFLIPSYASAGNFGPELPIAEVAYDQQNPHEVFIPDKGSDGLYFVVWEDWRNINTTGADIYGQFIRVDSTTGYGVACGNAFIISNAPGNQTAPRVDYRNGTLLGDNNSVLVVTWQDTRGSVSGPPVGSASTNPGGFIWYQAINIKTLDPDSDPTCSGAVQSTAVSVDFQNDSLSGTSYSVTSRALPKIAYDIVGDRFVLAWVESRSARKTMNYTPFPFFPSFQADWVYGDTQFVGFAAIKGDLSGYQTAPEIITRVQDPSGTIDFTRARLIAELDGPYNSQRTYEIFDQVANVDLSCDSTQAECLLVWEALKGTVEVAYTCAKAVPPETESIPGYCSPADTITIDTTNTKTTYDYASGIYGLYEKDINLGIGSPRISEYCAGVNMPSSPDCTAGTTTQGQSPAIGFDSISKRFLVTWDDMRNGINTKIYGQLISSGSSFYNKNFIISYEDTNGDGQQDPNVANSAQTGSFVSFDPVNERFFVIWQDGRNTSVSLPNLDIYGQRVNLDGSLSGDNYAVSTLPYNQLHPVIAYNVDDEDYLVVWKDARNTDANLNGKGDGCTTSSGPGTGNKPCGADIFGQEFSLEQASLTLLNPDSTELAPPILQNFQNPSGSGSVGVGSFATQSFIIKNTGDAILHIDCIDYLCRGGTKPASSILPFTFDGLPTELTTCNDGVTLDLAPAAQLTLTVRFTPTVAGSFNESFCILSDGGNPQVSLSGLSIEPVIQIISPTSISPFDFGSVNIGSFKDQIFTVKNAGLAPLIISSITAPTAPFSIQSDSCSGQTIATGLTCAVTVRFTPTAVVVSNSQFTINSNDPVTPNLIVAIKGTGVGAAHITAMPTTINFGPVQINQKVQQTITVTSSGTNPLTISPVVPPSAPFSIFSNNCPGSLSVGNSCQIVVQFAPTSTGTVSSSFVISSNDPTTPSLTINLSGTGVVTPVISVNPTSYNFPSTAVGSTSNEVFNVSNVGTAPLTISGFTNPALTDFSIAGSTCIGTLAPLGMCTVTIAFTPASGGFKSSSFAILSNDPVNPSFTVLLSGSGSVSPMINAVPNPLSFGSHQVGAMTSLNITVSNSGLATLNITSVSNPAAPFSVTSDGCLGPLASKASCQITVQFAPTSGGLANSSIIIASNDPTTPSLTVNLTGTGTTPPTIMLNPTSINFGAHSIGTSSPPQTVTVTNIGGANLTISSVQYPGAPFSVISNTCTGQTLAPLGTCTVTLVFNPTRKAVFNPYYLTFKSNDPVNPSSRVTLSGQGVK
ncbi:MAG: choice-of-anchor D domain-containing protein [Dissulfurispiraceae bacterium]